jgi:hypothetical protein
LSIEQLEGRCCPSLSVSFLGGSLYISGYPSGQTADPNGPTLAITETGTHLFTVMDGNASAGAYAISGSIYLNLNRRPNTIDITLNASGLGGNLSLNLGSGDTVGPPSPIYLHGGRVNGSVTILKGNGNETFDLGQGPGGADPLSVGGDVTVVASLSTGNGFFTPPRDTLNLVGTSSVGGSLYTTNVDSVFLDAPSSVGRNVSINDALELTSDDVTLLGAIGQDVTINGAPAGTTVEVAGTVGRNLNANLAGFGTDLLVLDITSTVGGSATIYDRLGGGFVFLLGLIGKDATILAPQGIFVNVSGTVGRNLNANLAGAGQDFFTLVSTATVGGSAIISTGSGDDFVTVDGAVLGSLAVNLGQGDDNLAFDPTATVGGNMSVSGGNGVITVSLFEGLVTGNLSFNFGNGNNNPVTVVFAPGGRLTWRSGNGTNQLILGTSPTSGNFNVDAGFGSNDDTFTVDVMSGTVSGRVDGGGRRITGNVFQLLSGSLVPNFQMINFP